jgi:hypothetical protein
MTVSKDRSSRAADYSARAADCEERAQRNADPVAKRQLEHFARKWREIASETGKHHNYG